MVYGRVGHIYRPRPSTGSVISESTDAHSFFIYMPRPGFQWSRGVITGGKYQSHPDHVLAPSPLSYIYTPPELLMRIT